MKITDRIAKLIDVKSIVTITIVVVLSVVTLKQLPIPDLFSNATMLVLGFFFGKNITTKEVEK